MHPLTAKQIIAILLANDFVLTRQRGSHQIYTNKNTGATVPVPLHGKNRPIYIGTFMAIMKQSKLPKEMFEK